MVQELWSWDHGKLPIQDFSVSIHKTRGSEWSNRAYKRVSRESLWSMIPFCMTSTAREILSHHHAAPSRTTRCDLTSGPATAMCSSIRKSPRRCTLLAQNHGSTFSICHNLERSCYSRGQQHKTPWCAPVWNAALVWPRGQFNTENNRSSYSSCVDWHVAHLLVRLWALFTREWFAPCWSMPPWFGSWLKTAP